MQPISACLHWLTQKHRRVSAITVCFLLVAQQLASVAVYFCWYSNFLEEEEEEDVPMSKSYDPGALLAITLTTITTATFNVMLVYGVWQKRLSWIIPFLILYAGLIIECLAIIVFIVAGVSSIEKVKVVYPATLFFLFSVIWLFVREIFKNMMVEKSRQSPESKDIFELQYQTNCSVNVSYNFTNSDLQDAAENKV